MNLFFERLLFVIALLIMVFPMISVPRDFKDALLVLFGAILLAISFVFRNRKKQSVIKKTE